MLVVLSSLVCVYASRSGSRKSDLISTHVFVRIHATIVSLALSFHKRVAQSILENMNFSSLSCGHRMAVFYKAFYLVLFAIELSDLLIFYFFVFVL